MGGRRSRRRRLPSLVFPRSIRHGSQRETCLPRSVVNTQAQLWWRRTEVRPRRCRQPDRPRPRLRVRQHGPVAMDVLPPQAQGLRLACADVERKAPLPHPYPNMWRLRTIPSGRMLLQDRPPSCTCQPKTARPPVRTAVSPTFAWKNSPASLPSADTSIASPGITGAARRASRRLSSHG